MLKHKKVLIFALAVLVIGVAFIMFGPVSLIALPLIGMAVDKSQLKGGTFDVFLAARADSETAPAAPTLATVQAGGDATWKFAGGLAENDPAIDASSPNVQIISDGTQKQLSVPWKVTLNALELNKLNVFEAVLDSYVDMIVVKRGTSSASRFNRLGMSIGYAHGNSKEASKFPITLVALSDKISDLRSEITLV